MFSHRLYFCKVLYLEMAYKYYPKLLHKQYPNLLGVLLFQVCVLTYLNLMRSMFFQHQHFSKFHILMKHFLLLFFLLLQHKLHQDHFWILKSHQYFLQKNHQKYFPIRDLHYLFSKFLLQLLQSKINLVCQVLQLLQHFFLLEMDQ